jgi:poly(3-hydroxybutyrate) depolymerase
MRIACAVRAVCLALILPASLAFAADRPVFDAPRLDGIVVDGRAADWADRGLRLEPLVGFGGPALTGDDLVVHARAGWSDEGLLIFARITDDALRESSNEAWLLNRDAVEISLSAGLDSTEFIQYYVLPGISTERPNAQTEIADHRMQMASGPTPAITASSVMLENGYAVEALAPWESLAIRPEIGTTFGFRLAVIDIDDPLPGPGLRYSKDYVALCSPPGSPFDPKRVFGLRLAADAAPATPPRCSYRHVRAWFPRVVVCGAGAAPGKRIEVVDKEGHVLGKGPFEEAEGLYVAEIKLPYPKSGVAMLDVKVLLDGKEIDSATLPCDGKKPGFGFYLPQEPEAKDTARFRLDMLNYGGDALGDGPVPIDVFDANGKKVEQVAEWLGTEVRLHLPPGLYYLRSEFDYYGMPYLVEGGVCVGEQPGERIDRLLADARAAKSVPENLPYAGMIEYLAGKVEDLLTTESIPYEQTLTEAARLAQWIARIAKEPNSLAKLRGRHEWAYLSDVDGAGQPFVIEIPEDYDAARAYPLFIYLHGSMALHTESYDPPMLPNEFRLFPLGRAVSAGYGALCEMDILEAMDYVTSHWNIDLDRIHLSGVSMGGGGSYSIPSRHPDRFASVRAVSGYGLDAPVENLLNLPFTAIHGTADWMVPLDEARGAVVRGVDAGAPARMVLIEGIGHGMPHEGMQEQRARAEAAGHRRVHRPRRVHYTATDEIARGAYWVTVEEWGPEGRPAVVDAQLGDGNVLYLVLDNVTTMKMDVAASPADRDRDMPVVVNGLPISLISPRLPDALYLAATENGWDASGEQPAQPVERLHFPGGATALYHGEPLMVVWGTQGNDEMNAAIRRIADIVRRSPNPNWPTDEKGKGRFLNYTLWGRLHGKPDTEVTVDDMATHNLILLGTAEQNGIVARIAADLPVKLDGDRVTASDGVSWSFKDRAFALLHYNPLAPKRLIYWVASNVPEFYRPETPLMEMARSAPASPDFILADAITTQTVAARRFDSRWQWEPGYGASPLLQPSQCDRAGFTTAYADAVRREAGAHFAIGEIAEEWTADDVWAPGVTRAMDVRAVEYGNHIGALDLSGREILDMLEAFQRDQETRYIIVPNPDDLQPDRVYRVAMPTWLIWHIAERFRRNYPSFRLLDATVRDAMLNHLE